MKKLVPALLCVLALHSLSSVAQESTADEEKTEPRELPLEALQSFVDTFHQIREHYVEEVDDKTLLMMAIEGMLNGLDPHSRFFEDEALEDLEADTKGQFGGLGIEVGSEKGFIKVIAPMDNTPAEKAGLKSGDLIGQLDGQSVADMNVNDAIDMMRGEPGTSIDLVVYREGEEKPLNFTIVRDIIKVKSVRSRWIDNQIGYLRIAQFQQTTAQDAEAELQKMLAEHEIKGLILDLRNNPGGLLDAAVKLSDLFLNEGKIVYTEGRNNMHFSEYMATPGDLLQTAPIVVLINGGSASASEIVAGALQDYKRAVVIGTQSFGKGSVQNVVSLNEHQAIKLTTSRYFTPLGRSIQAQGIVPDILVAPGEARKISERNRFTEASLRGHLENNQDAQSSENAGPDLPDDAQIVEAYNILHAMTILPKISNAE